MTITLPPLPRPVPPLVVDPGAVRECGGQLLTASAQVDDLGSFVAGPARLDDWLGQGSSAYHAGVAPLGRRADAMSLALRAVARRVEAHAGEMTALLERRVDLQERREHLGQQVVTLREQALTATVDDAAAIQADCDRVAREVGALHADVTVWASDLAAEEQQMTEAFTRVLSLDDVERRHGGQVDPADAALATRPPAGSPPEQVARWWEGLTREQQQAVVVASPGSVGNLDGIPAGARDAANTVALDRDLATWGMLEEAGLLRDDERTWLDNARAAERARDAIAGRTDPVTGEPIQPQVYLYDPAAFGGDGRVAISAGDLDTADHVAVVVPGFGTDAQSAPYQADRAATLFESARFLDPDQSSAAMFWIGYDAPDNLPWKLDGFDAAGVLTEGAAAEGGERLADAIDGLRAGRDGDPAHLTTIGHSYGSTTTGHAAHDEGLATDDLVFVGSPGVGGDTDHAGDTGVDPDHVWAGANSRDPVTYVGNHGSFHLEVLGGGGLGDDPAEDDFGARRFEAESTTRGSDVDLDQHSLYFDHDTESLHNLSQIILGHYDQVSLAPHNYDPWLDGVQDPELDRTPTSVSTR